MTRATPANQIAQHAAKETARNGNEPVKAGNETHVADPKVPLRVLSLFSGVGGLDLGFDLACRDVGIQTRHVGYLEREAFAVACLVAAMDRGDLAPAPVFVGDVASARYPAADVVLAGFPCPPVSCAGKRLGVEDDRWLWPEVVRAVRDSGARFVGLENVRGLLSANDGAAFGAVLGDLADLGFDAEWQVLRASDVGAPHRRERVFVLGYRNEPRTVARRAEGASRSTACEPSRDVADGTIRGLGERGEAGESRDERHADRRRPGDVADARSEPGRPELKLRERTDEPRDGRPPLADGDGGRREFERRARGVTELQPGNEPHRRGRAVGDAACVDQREPDNAERAVARDDARDDARRAGGIVEDADIDGLEGRERAVVADPRNGGQHATAGRSGRGAELADADDATGGPERESDPRERSNREPQRGSVPRDASRFPFQWPPGPGDIAAWAHVLAADPDLAPGTAPQPDLRDVAHGLPEGVGRSDDVGPADAWRVLRAVARIEREIGGTESRVERCPDFDGRYHVGGLCSDVPSIRTYVEKILADPERWGLGEWTVTALVQRAARWRRLTPPSDRRRSATTSGPVAGSETGLSPRADALRALGNAVVPAQARLAFAGLWRRVRVGVIHLGKGDAP